MIIKSGEEVELKNILTGRVDLVEFQGLVTDKDNKVIGYLTNEGPYSVWAWEMYGMNFIKQ